MKENPTCRALARADLKAFADGELSPLARWRVAQHVRACPACRQELIQMQTLSTELQKTEGETAPLDAELRAHILESAPTVNQDNSAQLRKRRITRKKVVLAFGACAVAGLFIMTASQSFLGSSAPSNYGSNDIIGPASSNDRSAPIAGNSASTSAGTYKRVDKLVSPGDNLQPSDAASGAATSASGRANGGHRSGIIVGGGDDTLFTDGHVKAAQSPATGEVESAQNELRPTQQQASLAQKFSSRRADVATDKNPIAVYDENGASFLPPSRVVHREGSLSVSVVNAENASDDAATIIKNAGGFIANTALETGSNQKRTATLDCRVPVAQFETVVRKIGALGTVRAKSLSGQDITTQVARSGARRQALSKELSIAQARLAERENSKKKLDTYELRAEVRTARIQAAQARAQLEALQKYGSLSSLYVSLQDASPVPTAKAAGWTDSLSPTSRAAWDAFVVNIRLPLQLLLWVLAYSPLWLPLLLIWRKFGRKWLEA